MLRARDNSWMSGVRGSVTSKDLTEEDAEDENCDGAKFLLDGNY